MSEPKEAKRRKRPGRFRRWVLRPAVWALVLLVLAVAGALLYLRSDAAAERARALVAARLSDALGRPVEIGDLRLGLAPLSAEFDDLVIPGPEPGDRPVLVAPRGRVEASLSDLRRKPVLHLDRLWLQRPEIYLRFNEDGTNNLPVLARSDGPSRVEVEIGRLTVEGGVVEVEEQRLPLDLDAQGVSAALDGSGRGPELELAGRVVAERLVTTLPQAQPYPLAVEARVRVARGKVEVTGARLEGEEVSATGGAVYTWNEGERRLHADVAGRAVAELVTRLGYAEGGVEGPVELTASVDWNGEVWSLAGDLSSPRLVLAERVLTGVEAELAGDPEALRVNLARAGYAGGTIAGVIRVGLGESPAPVAVDVTVRELAVRHLIDDQGLTVEGLGGRVAGGVTYRFTSDDPLAGNGWADLEVTASQQLAQGRIPFTGKVPLSIARGVVTSQAVRLRSPSQRLLIEDLRIELATGSGRLDYHLDSDDVGRLAVLLPPPTPGEPPLPWMPTSGRGTIAGEVSFVGGDYVAETRLELEEVATADLRADQVAGTLALTPVAVDPLRLELTRNGGALMINGRVPLGEGEEAFELTIDAAAWPLEEARAFLPFELPVAGPVSGRLELAGTAEALSGEVAVTVAPAEVMGLAAERAEATLSFDPERLTVTEARLVFAAGEVTAAGTLGLGEGGELDLDLEAPGLSLAEAPFADLVGEGVGGRLRLTGRLGGTLELPRAHLELASDNLELGSRSLGSATAVADWDGTELTASGSLLGLVDFSGGGLLSPEEAAVALDLKTDDLGALYQLATGTPLPALAGSASGVLTLRGALTEPAIELQLDRVDLAYEALRLANLEPVVVRLTPPTLEIASLYLGEQGGDGEIFLAGGIGLEGDVPLDLRLQATASARWVELVLPEIRLAGTLNALGRVRGTAAAPALDGQADLADGELILPGFPHSLENLRAVALIYSDQLVLDSLRARFAGGQVRAAGRVALGADGPGDYRLQMSAEGVRLRYPEGWVLEGDAELSLVPAEEGRLLRGTVTLDRAYYLQDLQLGVFQLMQRFLRRQRLEVGVADPELVATQLNIVINAPGAVRVRNNVADLRGDAELVVRGSLARPIPVGQVEMTRGGTLLYGDADYTVERGLLTFSSLDKIDPILDLVATTELREYDVTLNLSGTLDRLNASFTSDPPLPDLDVLALLTTGKPLGGGGQLGGVSAGSGAGAETFLYGQAASAVTSRVKTLFGFDKFRVDPLAGAGGSVSTARLVVGKQISRDLYVTYTRDPSSNQEDLVRAEWQVGPGVVLVLTVTDGQQYALDVQWERRF